MISGDESTDGGGGRVPVGEACAGRGVGVRAWFGVIVRGVRIVIEVCGAITCDTAAVSRSVSVGRLSASAGGGGGAGAGGCAADGRKRTDGGLVRSEVMARAGAIVAGGGEASAGGNDSVVGGAATATGAGVRGGGVGGAATGSVGASAAIGSCGELAAGVRAGGSSSGSAVSSSSGSLGRSIASVVAVSRGSSPGVSARYTSILSSKMPFLSSFSTALCWACISDLIASSFEPAS